MLHLSSLHCGDRVRLCRPISGYEAGTISTVVDILPTQNEKENLGFLERVS